MFQLQPRFRSMWERYCRGVNAIVYMVDAADHDKIEVCKHLIKLHRITCKGYEMTQNNDAKIQSLRFHFRHQGMSYIISWKNHNWQVYRFWF